MGIIMETIFLDDFVDDGIIRESSFRLKIKSIDWEIYKDKNVLIKGCASIEVPTWAYMIITANLSTYAKKILFGEPCSAIKIL
tara:strand:+ start:145 stop:393 length:249 start_codon:yes stop_codon:yes gene_type:complete